MTCAAENVALHTRGAHRDECNALWIADSIPLQAPNNRQRPHGYELTYGNGRMEHDYPWEFTPVRVLRPSRRTTKHHFRFEHLPRHHRPHVITSGNAQSMAKCLQASTTPTGRVPSHPIYSQSTETPKIRVPVQYEQNGTTNNTTISQAHSIDQIPAKATMKLHPANTAVLPAAPLASGILFVAAPPRYQLPMSVSSPSWVSMAALGPTFETSLRKEPK